MEDVRDLVGIDPSDSAVIHIGNLEEAVHLWVSSTSLTEDDLSHPPRGVVWLGRVHLFVHDDEVTRRDRQEYGRRQ